MESDDECCGATCKWLSFSRSLFHIFMVFTKLHVILAWWNHKWGSITSWCSGNEPVLLLQTGLWTRGFAVVGFHKSDYCPFKLSRQHKFIFLEQIPNGGCGRVVWCDSNHVLECFKIKNLKYREALEKLVNGRDVLLIWIMNHFPVCSDGCWPIANVKEMIFLCPFLL